MPLCFVANQGQLDPSVAYYLQGSDKTLYLTPGGVTFALTKAGSSAAPGGAKASSAAAERWVVKLDFLGPKPVTPAGQSPTDAVIAYFKGYPDKWQTGLPTYSSISYSDLWPGIDVSYRGTGQHLKQEFVLKPAPTRRGSAFPTGGQVSA